ncbi:uncharacterized protein [Leptinotarsa decemlineata]|uniref:uncharacterized protein n=1 Tax=Leptinotarsa decemlineata TaxID=7539 RepID=UPI003D30B6B0
MEVRTSEIHHETLSITFKQTSDLEQAKRIRKKSTLLSSSDSDSEDDMYCVKQMPVFQPKASQNRKGVESRTQPEMLEDHFFKDENSKRQILRQLNILNIKMDQLSQDISNINLIESRQYEDPVQQESILDQFQLPLRTEEDLNLFEDFLQNKENVSKVVSIFPLYLYNINYVFITTQNSSSAEFSPFCCELGDLSNFYLSGIFFQ